MAATSINCLAVVLKELDWSYSRLIAELRRLSAITENGSGPHSVMRRRCVTDL